MTAIALATRNAHKAREIRSILNGDFHFLTLDDFARVPAVEEDAPSFAGNASKKASALAQWIQRNTARALEKFTRARATIYVVADDSGLEVDALDGAPGVRSARFAAPQAATGSNAPDEANNARLLESLKGVPREKRTARFRCVLAVIPLILAEGAGHAPRPLSAEPLLFEGVCEGRIAVSPTGRGGFGYDPLFIPVGYELSFAELSEGVKNSVSHRFAALRKLRQFLQRPV